MIKDKYNRPILSLRISITNRCNINCFYCHHDGMENTKEEMISTEIYEIVKIAKTLGVEKIRISGGEPLIRPDIVEIIEKINTLDFKDISITTNGILLKKYAKKLKKAGLNRVNISLDTLNEKRYEKITEHNKLKEVKEGIKEAKKAGLNPVKINMVLLNNINTDEIWEIFEYCRENDLILQLIELMETDLNNINENYNYDFEKLEKELEEKAEKIETRELMQNRKKYYIENGEIELVKPIENTSFCNNCTRLRITPEGKLKPCLLRNDNLVDIISSVRENKTEYKLKEIFLKAIENREPYYIKN